MASYTEKEWTYPMVGSTFGVAAGVAMANPLVGAALAIIFSFAGYAIAQSEDAE